MKIKTGFCLFLFIFLIPAFGQKSNNFVERFSLESSVGYNRVPGVLFSLDKSVTRHPDNFSGLYRNYSLNYELNKKWSLGLSFIDITSAGRGEWSRSNTEDEFKQNGVSGIVTGKTRMDIQGGVFSVRRVFFVNKRAQPYLQIGLGLGSLNVSFNGQFVGHETESGYNFPVVEDAEDHVRHLIPLVGLESGIRCRVFKHLYVSGAPYWNTGFGYKFGAEFKF